MSFVDFRMFCDTAFRAVSCWSWPLLSIPRCGTHYVLTVVCLKLQSLRVLRSSSAASSNRCIERSFILQSIVGSSYGTRNAVSPRHRS